MSGGNLILKVLGKEFEEEPFFKRVFLNNIVKICKNAAVIECVFLKLPVVAECIDSVSKLAHIGICSAIRSLYKLCKAL